MQNTVRDKGCQSMESHGKKGVKPVLPSGHPHPRPRRITSSGEHGTSKRISRRGAETQRGERFYVFGFLSVPASLRDKVPPGAVGRSVPLSLGGIWITGGQAAQRGRFALPRLEWERGKGGANRPGERRAADVLVEDSEVPHGLQLNCMGS